MATDASIDINNLSKRYGKGPLALSGVSLHVSASEVYGFLGANGAGKSTTIRTLLNFLQPSGGSASICGLDIVRDSVAVKKHVGYLAGELAMYPRLTGQQFLDYMAALQPVKDPAFKRSLIQKFDARLDMPLKNLSKGNRQKIGIIQALMHQPDVLILDEPTSGLDPLMQDVFYECIRESRARGAVVFVSSHNFGEVERMCDRIGFIRDGKLVSEQTLSDLASKAAHTFVLTFKDAAPTAELHKLHGAKLTAHDDHHVTLSMEGELTPLFTVLAKHHVTRMQQQEVNLEEEFLRFYQKEHA